MSHTDQRQVRDAATVILLRKETDEPQILMGQRGKNAAFYPNRFVFPGGAVDEADAHVPVVLPTNTHRLLGMSNETVKPTALAAAAIRELREETGLTLRDAQSPDLQFVFRAITPPARPRRFDARFFMLDANAVAGALDDFSDADSELAHLSWVKLSDVRQLDLPMITQVVVDEVRTLVGATSRRDGVPFFDHRGDHSRFELLV